MVLRLRGRLILQGYVFVELEEDRREYRASDRGPKARAKITFELSKAAVASLAIWYPGPIDRATTIGIGWIATRIAQAGGVVLHQVIAPIGVGIAIGATAGTAISAAIWGEEGAQVALGFYSAGTLPGTEAPDLRDYQYIFKPTAPGGPVSLYDVAEAGARGTSRGLGWLWSNRPQPRGSPYLI